MMPAAGGGLELPEHLVEIERGRPLTWRELDVVLDLLGHERLHLVKEVGMRDHPIPVSVRVFIRPLKRVAAQVEYLWGPELDERLEPAHQLLRPLLHQHQFPIANSDREDIAVVADIENKLPRALLRLAGQIGQQIVPVDMYLEGLVAYRMPVEKLFRDFRLASRSEQRWQPILVRGDVVQPQTGFDLAGPTPSSCASRCETA